MSDELAPTPSQFLVYRDEAGNVRLDVRFERETVWLTQAQLAELFGTTPQNVTQHIGSVYEEGELEAEATRKDYLQVRQEGARKVSRNLTHYNLDMIISIGYRVRSKTATQFRIWATQRLREYIVKGFMLDDERLKNPDQPFDYFEELLRRIQEIRTSERRFYQKITDVYATSIDYDPDAPITKTFYATVQNKLHWAIVGQTAAEVIKERADASKPNMALTSRRGVKPRKADAGIAKNYYTEDELRQLNNLVEQYLVFAQSQAERRFPMRMADWSSSSTASSPSTTARSWPTRDEFPTNWPSPMLRPSTTSTNNGGYERWSRTSTGSLDGLSKKAATRLATIADVNRRG